MFRENFGVPGVIVSGGVQGFLVERAGGDGIHFAGQPGPDAGEDILKRGFATARIRAARRDGIGVKALQIEHSRTTQLAELSGPIRLRDHGRGEGLAQLLGDPAKNCGVAEDDGDALRGGRGMIEQLQTDFRADAGGIAQCDCDAGTVHLKIKNPIGPGAVPPTTPSETERQWR